MKDLKEMFKEFDKSRPACDMCKCSVCGWEGKIQDCESEVESNGWEYPDYLIDLCPECPDGGCIDDYWYSRELWEKIR